LFWQGDCEAQSSPFEVIKGWSEVKDPPFPNDLAKIFAWKILNCM